MVYNIMTCGGFGTEVLGGCSLAWAGFVVLFFLGALLRKYAGEDMDIDFSFFGSLVIGFLSYLVVVTITGSPRWSIVVGIIGIVVGGYGAPFIIDTEG